MAIPKISQQVRQEPEFIKNKQGHPVRATQLERLLAEKEKLRAELSSILQDQVELEQKAQAIKDTIIAMEELIEIEARIR